MAQAQGDEGLIDFITKPVYFAHRFHQRLFWPAQMRQGLDPQRIRGGEHLVHIAQLRKGRVAPFAVYFLFQRLSERPFQLKKRGVIFPWQVGIRRFHSVLALTNPR